MSENLVISYESNAKQEDTFPFRTPEASFRIDALGIARPHHPLLKWSDVQLVRTWITSADGEWGIEEYNHLENRYVNGARFYVNDVDGMYAHFRLLNALRENLSHFLPGIATDWEGVVFADYQRHTRRQKILNRFSFSWYPNKPVIYRK